MILTVFFLLQNFAEASLCKNWSKSEFWGVVPAEATEASGIIVSKNFPDRIYHINDGKKVPLIVSDKAGKKSRSVKIEDIKMKDIEDLAYGQCPDKKGECIYVADIGDNEKVREKVNIIVIREADFSESVKPLDVWPLSYPDHPHNAEALALHPNGDLYIVTKEKRKGEASPAQVFKASIFNPGKKFTHVGEINLPKLSKNQNVEDHVVTGMTISEDGKKFILLNYLRAWEFNIDLSQPLMATENMKLGVDFQSIDIEQLRQQEAITFLDAKSFIYSSENGQNNFADVAVKVVRCRD